MNWLKGIPEWFRGLLAAHVPIVRSTSDAPVELSAEVDSNGRGIQRVVDAAPWAYDPANDLTKTAVVRRESVIIQTHNAQNVSVSGSHTSATVVDCRGYDSLCVAILTDSGHSRRAEIVWHIDNGTTVVGTETIITTASTSYGYGRTPVKASYAKIKIFNEDAGAAHTMSSWTTLIP